MCLLEQSFDHEIHMSFRTDDTSVPNLNSYATHKHKQLFIRGPGGHIQLRFLLLLWHHSTLCLQSTANYPVMYVPSTIHTRRRACGELVHHPTALYMLLLAEKLSALTFEVSWSRNLCPCSNPISPSCFLHQHCTDMTINAMCNLPDTHVTRLLSVVNHGNMMTQCHSPGTWNER